MQQGININLSRSTHAALLKIGRKGETFDQVVIRLLEVK